VVLLDGEPELSFGRFAFPPAARLGRALKVALASIGLELFIGHGFVHVKLSA
jgi:hypothetical protein